MLKLHVSEATLWQDCRRKHAWSSREKGKLEPLTYYAPFFVGSAVHYAVEMHHGKGMNLIDALNEYVREKSHVTKGKSLSKLPDNIIADMDLARNMLLHYGLWYPRMKGEFSESRIKTAVFNGKPATEIKFSCPLYDASGHTLEGVLLEGKIDRIVQDEQGRFWVIEYKTTSDIAGRLALLNNELQPACYLIGAERSLGIKLEGVIYQLLLKKVPKTPEVLQRTGLYSTSDTSLKSMSYDWFRSLVGNDEMYGDALFKLIRKPNDYFERVPIRIVESQRRERELDLVSIAQEILDPRTRITHRRGYHCVSFGGCAFKAPCDADYDPELQRRILEKNYRVREDEELYD